MIRKRSSGRYSEWRGKNELLTQGIFNTSEMLQYNQRKPLFKEVCLCISSLAIQNIVPPVPAGQVSGRSATISATGLRSAARWLRENV